MRILAVHVSQGDFDRNRRALVSSSYSSFSISLLTQSCAFASPQILPIPATSSLDTSGVNYAKRPKSANANAAALTAAVRDQIRPLWFRNISFHSLRSLIPFLTCSFLSWMNKMLIDVYRVCTRRIVRWNWNLCGKLMLFCRYSSVNTWYESIMYPSLSETFHKRTDRLILVILESTLSEIDGCVLFNLA